jgi:AbrB family looped-hinge helix DNA binding protein
METTKLSTKGQLILPKAIRSAHNWKPGTVFAIEEKDGGVLLRPVAYFEPTKFEDVRGCLKYHGRPKTLEEMDQAIIDEVKRRHARGRY